MDQLGAQKPAGPHLSPGSAVSAAAGARFRESGGRESLGGLSLSALCCFRSPFPSPLRLSLLKVGDSFLFR